MFSKLRIPTFHILLISLFSFFSLHETFNMFFVGDDFGFAYKMQNGFSFAWPQHQLVNMYRPLYNMFHAEPFGYFASGFLIFVISALLFYFLAKEVFSNNSHALIAALIYVTAPVGIESVTMMLLYLGSYYALALLNLILIFFLKFLKTGKILYFTLSILVLLFAFETVAYRAFLFPIVMFFFGIFFWHRKKLTVNKIIISYIMILFLSGIMYLFRPYLMDIQGRGYVTNLNPSTTIERFGVFTSKFEHYFLGNIYYENMDSAFVNAIITNPINAVGPLIGIVNIIFTLPFISKIVPQFHYPLLVLLIVFSVFIIIKRKKITNSYLNIYFASLAFIFAEVLAFFIPYPKIIMPLIGHYGTYALPGYALFITSVFLIMVNLLNKQKNAVLKTTPYLLLIIIIAFNLNSTRAYLNTYNQRISYVRPFFKQLKELQPTLPTNPIIFIEVVVGPDDDPAEARWRLYDTWRGGIHGANVLFGLYYPNVDANQTIATPTWDLVTTLVKEDPKNINRIYSFRYDLHGLSLTTEQVRQHFRSLVATGDINR